MLESDAAADSTGHHDFTFPENIASYKAGTVVLQPKDGKTYECKPFPYSGYCVQYSPTANQFERRWRALERGVGVEELSVLIPSPQPSPKGRGCIYSLSLWERVLYY